MKYSQLSFNSNKALICSIFFVLGVFTSSMLTAATIKDPSKGLFTVQFSWNPESFSNKLTVELKYKKIGLLNRAKLSEETFNFAKKNTILALNLRDGDYELKSLYLKGEEIGYGKALIVPINKTFSVKSGIVTNGGLIFIGKDTKSSKIVYSMTFDNTLDVKRYVQIHESEFEYQLENMESAWKFLDKNVLDGIIKKYAASLIKRENRKPRPNVNYMYTTLGIMIKMQRDANGKVIDYKLISTPGYQEIVKAKKKDKRLLCTLSNGDFLYGSDNGLDYIPLPKSLEKTPVIHLIGENQFLMIDADFGIFYADDTFQWKEQLEFKIDRKYGLFSDTQIIFPKVYMGTGNVYIYSSAWGKNKMLLSSPYDNIRFEEIALSKKVKRVPMVTETGTKIILGPDLKLEASAKRPAFLYVKYHNSDSWEVVDLPSGDCNRFSVNKNNDDIFHVDCFEGLAILRTTEEKHGFKNNNNQAVMSYYFYYRLDAKLTEKGIFRWELYS